MNNRPHIGFLSIEVKSYMQLAHISLKISQNTLFFSNQASHKHTGMYTNTHTQTHKHTYTIFLTSVEAKVHLIKNPLLNYFYLLIVKIFFLFPIHMHFP